MGHEYNSDGRLPIHEAAFRDYDDVVERILSDIALRGSNPNNDTEDTLTEEEKERFRALNHGQVQEMVEAITFDYFRLTPILAATIGNARRTIECLIRHGAKVTCRDGNNRSMAAITIFKQNADLFLYFAEAPYANELDLWNTLMVMFTSREIDDSSAAGKLLEQLTSRKYINDVWPRISNLRLVEKTMQVLTHTVNNYSSFANDSLLTSCLIILHNLLYIDPNVRNVFVQNEDGTRAFTKIPKANETIILLFLSMANKLCDDGRCIQVLVNENLIGEIQTLLDTDTESISNAQICLYFGTLSKIAHCATKYQALIQSSSATNRSIVEQAIDFLERFDRESTIAIFRFIHELCCENEQQQQICAENNLLIAYLLSGLTSMHKEVQRSSVETLQTIALHNTTSQYTILQQGGDDQLRTLLDRVTLPELRISILCTLWSLAGTDYNRRQSTASSLSSKIFEIIKNFKGGGDGDEIYTILDITSELLRQIPTKNSIFSEEMANQHCISPLVRLLVIDREHKTLIKCLHCIQQLCVLPTFRPCQTSQTMFVKANGLKHLLLLARRANKEKLVQTKAITTIACVVFQHKENKEKLTNTVARRLFRRIGSLLKFGDEEVKIEAGIGLLMFICSDINYYNFCKESINLDPDDFRSALASDNRYIRCNAAYQMIALFRLFPDINTTEWIGQALICLFKVIGDRRIDDEEKILPTNIIGRLARVSTGFCEAIVTSDYLDYLIDMLNSANVILHSNAAVALECIVQDSPEGQLKLLKQCRRQRQFIEILRKYISSSSPLRTHLAKLYSSMHNISVHLPPIQTARQRQGIETNKTSRRT